MMEDLESLKCVVCCRLAQYAVLTPCCSSIACRMCAVTNITKCASNVNKSHGKCVSNINKSHCKCVSNINKSLGKCVSNITESHGKCVSNINKSHGKCVTIITESLGKCGACHSSPVLLSSLVPHHQVRRKVEIEVWKQVTKGEPVDKNNWKESNKRPSDHTNEINKMGIKRIKVEKHNRSELKGSEGTNADFPQEILKIEVVKEKAENETINSELSNMANCGIAESIDPEVTKNDSSNTQIHVVEMEKNATKSALLTSVAKHQQGPIIAELDADQSKCRQEHSVIKKELVDAKETLPIKEQGLRQLNKCIKNTFVEEEIKTNIEVKAALLENDSLTSEEHNAKNVKEEFANKKRELERKKDSENNNKRLINIKNDNVQVKNIGRVFRDKLLLAEVEIKRILEEKKYLDATIKSLKEKLMEMEEENQKLKYVIEDENGMEANIEKMRSKVEQIMAENKSLKMKMDEKEARYKKVLSNAKAKIEKVNFENCELQKKVIYCQAESDAMATEMKKEVIKVSTIKDKLEKVIFENKELMKKLNTLKSKALLSQFSQTEETCQLKAAFASSINSREQNQEKEEVALDYEIDKNRGKVDENVLKCQIGTKMGSKSIQEPIFLNKFTNRESNLSAGFKKKPDNGKDSLSAVSVASVTDKSISEGDGKPFPEIKKKPILDENQNSFSEADIETFHEINAMPTTNENRIQSADSTSKWRIIFMDCEKISDGSHAQFTQIGCYVYLVSNRRKSSFFLPMYPTKHEEYLQMKQKSDLLKTLHLTWEKETGFHFVEPDGTRIKAVSESEGFEDFLIFLGVTSEGVDNVLLLNSAKCILPLLFNKISLNLFQKYVAGICELGSFLTESLDDNYSEELPHTDEIYRSVTGKSFEEMTPTCAQTAKYMFKVVDKVCNRSIDFESFISKYFQPTSHFIEKFGHLETSGSETRSGDKVSLEIESSFRPGFLATVEMCRVDVVDLTGLEMCREDVVDLTGLQQESPQCPNVMSLKCRKTKIPLATTSASKKNEVDNSKSSLHKMEVKSTISVGSLDSNPTLEYDRENCHKLAVGPYMESIKEVHVLHVEDSSHIFACSTDGFHQLWSLQFNLQHIGSNLPFTTFPVAVNSVYLGQLSCGNWYRVVVLNIQNQKCLVYCPDFGFKEELSVDKVRGLQGTLFPYVKSVPFFGSSCRIDGHNGNPAGDIHPKWIYRARVKSKDAGIYLIDIVEKVKESPLSSLTGNDSCKDSKASSQRDNSPDQSCGDVSTKQSCSKPPHVM